MRPEGVVTIVYAFKGGVCRNKSRHHHVMLGEPTR